MSDPNVWVVPTTNGTFALFQRTSDGMVVISYPPADRLGTGQLVTISLDECVQGLYSADGMLLATWNDDPGSA